MNKPLLSIDSSLITNTSSNGGNSLHQSYDSLEYSYSSSQESSEGSNEESSEGSSEESSEGSSEESSEGSSEESSEGSSEESSEGSSEESISTSIVIYESNNDKCIICYCDDTEMNFLDLENNYKCTRDCTCKIIIHEKCFYQWLNHSNSCPLCRAKLTYLSYCDKFCMCICKCLNVLSYTITFLMLIYLLLKIVYSFIGLDFDNYGKNN